MLSSIGDKYGVSGVLSEFSATHTNSLAPEALFTPAASGITTQPFISRLASGKRTYSTLAGLQQEAIQMQVAVADWRQPPELPLKHGARVVLQSVDPPRCPHHGWRMDRHLQAPAASGSSSCSQVRCNYRHLRFGQDLTVVMCVNDQTPRRDNAAVTGAGAPSAGNRPQVIRTDHKL